jgi:hypothetical protein
MRLVGLAGTIAALATSLTVGSVAAAGSPTVGHVYVNNNTASQNTIAAFHHRADGSLTPITGSPFNAGGSGTGGPFDSARALQRTTDGRYLLATDPGSNQVSVLPVKPIGGLQLADIVASSGIAPISIAVHYSLVYVANGGAGGRDYTGFRLKAGGALEPDPRIYVPAPRQRAPRSCPDQPGRTSTGRLAGRPQHRPLLPPYMAIDGGGQSPRPGVRAVVTFSGRMGGTLVPRHRR